MDVGRYVSRGGGARGQLSGTDPTLTLQYGADGNEAAALTLEGGLVVESPWGGRRIPRIAILSWGRVVALSGMHDATGRRMGVDWYM